MVIFEFKSYEDKKCTILSHRTLFSTFIRGIGGFSDKKIKYKKWITIPNIWNIQFNYLGE